MKKTAFWYVVLLCSAWGLEIIPDSLTTTPSVVSRISAAIDTIMLKNTGESVVSIDTITITISKWGFG